MLDHLLGKPSSNWKRFQVILATFVSVYYLKYQPVEGPKFLRRWNIRLERYAPWQIILGTLTVVYLVKNTFLLLGLNAAEPLARLYSRSYYRATWIMMALDAGFWTAMPIKPKFLRDFFSIVFGLYYAVFADQADEKVRRIRALITVPHMRTSWEKATNPLLYLATLFTRPRLGVRKNVTISRPTYQPYAPDSIAAFLLYVGSEEELALCDELIIDYPGGGFVTMNPQCHEEYLAAWAAQTKCPLISIDYGKAPEYPYPWAIEECFDAYRTIVETNGSCLGINMNNHKPLKIAMIGDSAGGNIATAVVYKILEHDRPIRPPSGLVLAYPCLDFNISCWMPSQQLDLIRAASVKSLPGIMNSKNHLSHKSPLSVVPDKPHRFRTYLNTNIEDTINPYAAGSTDDRPQISRKQSRVNTTVGTRLAMTSRMSFFEDRIITPDLMRAMAILYIGPGKSPNFLEDYYLSPIVGPDHLLERFPPLYMMCGEKDPFVDDTVIFGGRIRSAKRNAWRRRQDARRQQARQKSSETDRDSSQTRYFDSHADSVEAEEEEGGIVFRPRGSRGSRDSLATVDDDEDTDGFVEEEFNENDHCTVKILEGISHGYMQMLSFLPEAKGAVRMAGTWLADILDNSTHAELHGDDTQTVSHEDLAHYGSFSSSSATYGSPGPQSEAPSTSSLFATASSTSTAGTPQNEPHHATNLSPSSIPSAVNSGPHSPSIPPPLTDEPVSPTHLTLSGGTTPANYLADGASSSSSANPSPRLARRRAAEALNGIASSANVNASSSASNASSTSSSPHFSTGATAHDEWERRNVIATGKELLERRRANLGHYFGSPTESSAHSSDEVVHHVHPDVSATGSVVSLVFDEDEDEATTTAKTERKKSVASTTRDADAGVEA